MKRKISLTFAVVLAMSATLGISYHSKKVATTGAAVSPAKLVRLTGVTVESIPEVVSATATLAAIQQVTIMPKVGGYINKIDFTEGQQVKAGAVLAQLDDTTQRQVYVSDQAATQFAKVTADRYLQLLKLNAASKQQMDQYLSDYKKAVAKQKSDEVALEETTLRSPISGYLGTANFNMGDFINAGSAFVTVTDIDTLKVEYSLPSSYAPKLKVGQKVTLHADYLPGKNLQATVSYVAPTVDAPLLTPVIPHQQHIVSNSH